MSQKGERIVLHIPVNFTIEELAALCRIREDSSAYEMLEDALPLINRYAKPGAVLRWVDVEEVTEDSAVIDGVRFESRVVADKLKSFPRVIASVVTAGSGLEECEELADDVFLDTYNGALIHHASRYLINYMQETFGYDGSSMLNPGSLPDWPIGNNFALFDLIGGAEEIGVSLNEAGYIVPWNSGSHINFPGDGYQNCSLCKKYDCIGRRAAFNRREYIRIFGVEP